MTEIIVLGPGCPKCIRLEEMCNEAVTKLQAEATVQKVMDPDEFTKHGVWLTPALIINGTLKVQGKLPVPTTLEQWIRTATPAKG
ncbi:MAG: thioredoxin family protein [Bacteroidetes bacterium]|nr:thioredoxin family protein [Bacteroidota bacterium]